MVRTILCSLLALVGLVVVGVRISNSQTTAGASAGMWTLPNATSVGNENLLMHTSRNHLGANQVILVDSVKRVMVVYFVSPDTGIIQLKSVRNLAADLQLEEFNGSDPSPAKVRGILGQP